MYINKSFLSTFFFVKLLGIPAMALKIRDHNHQILKEIIVKKKKKKVSSDVELLKIVEKKKKKSNGCN